MLFYVRGTLGSLFMGITPWVLASKPRVGWVWANGAGEGIRTLDILLGKQTLYH